MEEDRLVTVKSSLLFYFILSCFIFSAVTKISWTEQLKIKTTWTKFNTISRCYCYYVSLPTASHIHSDKWLKGLRVFLVLGDEENPQETESRSVEKAVRKK